MHLLPLANLRDLVMMCFLHINPETVYEDALCRVLCMFTMTARRHWSTSNAVHVSGDKKTFLILNCCSTVLEDKQPVLFCIYLKSYHTDTSPTLGKGFPGRRCMPPTSTWLGSRGSTSPNDQWPLIRFRFCSRSMSASDGRSGNRFEICGAEYLEMLSWRSWVNRSAVFSYHQNYLNYFFLKLKTIY